MPDIFGDKRAQKLLGRLGVEPLGADFAPEAFYQALRERKTAIKPLLLAGEVVVGVGNIYASEALFMAGIRPSTRAARIMRGYKWIRLGETHVIKR